MSTIEKSHTALAGRSVTDWLLGAGATATTRSTRTRRLTCAILLVYVAACATGTAYIPDANIRRIKRGIQAEADSACRSLAGRPLSPIRDSLTVVYACPSLH